MRLNSRVEIVKIDSRPNAEGYRMVQVAVNGHLAWPFDLHEKDWFEISESGGETAFADYLEHTAMTLLGRYGDARKVRIRGDGQIVPKEGEDEGMNAAI